jgi:DNA-binding YbaB/EbfC family protein
MAQMNMQKMMKEAKKMQDEIAKAQEEAKLITAAGSAGGGAVTAIATGAGVVTSIAIEKEVVDPEDVEMLQDLVLSAVNDAIGHAASLATLRMNAVTGGMNIPGL